MKPFSTTTRPETEPGPRLIKSGLVVQESGVSRGRRGAQKHITPDIETGTICSVGTCLLQRFLEIDYDVFP